MSETDTDISSNWDAPEPVKDASAEFSLEDDPNFGTGSIEEPPLAAQSDESPGWGALPAVEEAFETAGRVGGDQPVPRITIQAFCDRPEVSKVIETAGRDRRLTKAILTVTPGGIDAAVAALSEDASPNLIVVDTTAPAGALLRGLDRLAELVDEGSKVVIIGAVNDIALYPRTDAPRRERIYRAARCSRCNSSDRLRALREPGQAVRRPRSRP